MTQPAGKDNTQLFGILGIVIGLLCCSPAGIVLGVLSMNQAKKNGNSPTLGYVAIGVSVIGLIGGLIYAVSR
ncbi:hypothetical protein [Longispora urticae]